MIKDKLANGRTILPGLVFTDYQSLFTGVLEINALQCKVNDNVYTKYMQKAALYKLYKDIITAMSLAYLFKPN